MRDKVELQVAGQKIENFTSYTIEADIYTADDAFSLEVANPEIAIKPGQRCELWVNDKKELTGIIDCLSRRYDKQGVKLKIEGRDLMGLLVDSYCEEFFTVQGMTVKSLAEKLVRNVPFIQRSDIVYRENIRGNLKKKKGKKSGSSSSIFGSSSMGAAHTFAQVEPGQTIFEVLKTYAMSRGMMFFAMPDGTMAFGKPKDSGAPEFLFTTKKTDARENNVLEGSLDDNIAKRYSKVSVLGQQQGTDSLSASAINTKASVTDSTFPFYKPFVTRDNNDSRSPKLRAQMLTEKQKFDGWHLTYKVPHHSQNGKNYAINTICHVTDEVLGLDGDYLIYARTMERSRQGTFTTLKIGYPGVMQE